MLFMNCASIVEDKLVLVRRDMTVYVYCGGERTCYTQSSVRQDKVFRMLHEFAHLSKLFTAALS
jgi:hypothetical protein